MHLCRTYKNINDGISKCMCMVCSFIGKGVYLHWVACLLNFVQKKNIKLQCWKQKASFLWNNFTCKPIPIRLLIAQSNSTHQGKQNTLKISKWKLISKSYESDFLIAIKEFGFSPPNFNFFFLYQNTAWKSKTDFIFTLFYFFNFISKTNIN